MCRNPEYAGNTPVKEGDAVGPRGNSDVSMAAKRVAGMGVVNQPAKLSSSITLSHAHSKRRR